MTHNDGDHVQRIPYVCESFSIALGIILILLVPLDHVKLGMECITIAWEAVTTRPLWGCY